MIIISTTKRVNRASLLSTIHRFVNQEKKISCQLSTRKKKSVDRFG